MMQVQILLKCAAFKWKDSKFKLIFVSNTIFISSEMKIWRCWNKIIIFLFSSVRIVPRVDVVHHERAGRVDLQVDRALLLPLRHAGNSLHRMVGRSDLPAIGYDFSDWKVVSYPMKTKLTRMWGWSGGRRVSPQFRSSKFKSLLKAKVSCLFLFLYPPSNPSGF